MKRFSSNITDEELYRAFRDAAKHYDPKLNDSERKGIWESIAYQLLSDQAGKNKSIANKWKMRCIALLMLWLLTGGLAIFRIIQLQEISERKRSEPTTTHTIPLKDKTHRAMRAHPAPAGTADVKKNIRPYNCCSNNYTIVIDAVAMDIDIKRTTANKANVSVAVMERPGPNKAISSQVTRSTGINTDSTETKPAPPKKHKPTKQRLSIGLSTGAEWTKMLHNPLGRAGMLYGLTLQYRFAPRWSVEAGIMAAPKLYSTSTAFKYAMVSTPGEQRPIDVNCRIIDIQMNIRYDVMHKRDGRLFTGAGLSSFRVQKEDYTFYYELSGSWQKTNYKLYNENDHLFAAVHLMAGYEHSRGRFSAQAAPYLKIPLTDIGLGEMDLLSSGLQISVKYNIW